MRDVRRGEPPEPAGDEGVSRVVLVGFMAAGKSTVGALLAELLDWSFLDFDVEIERRTGLTVAEIFRRLGEPAFRALEAELTEAAAAAEQVVLAPGGGWITQPGLLERVAPGSLIVWLRISPDEAVARAARAPGHRPLLAGADPLAKAELLLREREPLYCLADLAIDVDGRESIDVAGEIAAEVSRIRN